MFQYRSRMDKTYDDDNSHDEGEVDEFADFSGTKTGVKFLKGQQAFLTKQLDKNMALMEIERQK